MNILYKTISGSRLYGTAHPNSDWDYYTVVDRVPKKKAKYHTHSIIDGLDSNVLDFGTWILECQAGVPQALEAMFSRRPEFDRLSEFRAAFRGGTETRAYTGMMKTMCMEHPDSFKHRRHQLRLGLNLQDLRETGRFNPTMSNHEIAWASNFAMENDMAECYAMGQALAGF